MYSYCAVYPSLPLIETGGACLLLFFASLNVPSGTAEPLVMATPQGLVGPELWCSFLQMMAGHGSGGCYTSVLSLTENGSVALVDLKLMGSSPVLAPEGYRHELPFPEYSLSIKKYLITCVYMFLSRYECYNVCVNI